ncbi:Oxaloacetate decarboxylase gamma chain, partial [human gut metagenome]
NFLERGMIMEGQAVTTNPWLIMAINMTVVFVVLILLGVLMTIVHLIDPTKKKKEVPASAPVAAPAATPVAAP